MGVLYLLRFEVLSGNLAQNPEKISHNQHVDRIMYKFNLNIQNLKITAKALFKHGHSMVILYPFVMR